MVWRCPPVLNVATIFGTVPSWCSASSISPLDTSETPDSAAICFACDCGNVSCVPGRKKSCTKCCPGLPSFDRSVRTDWFAWITWRSAPPPPKPPPPGPANPPCCCCCGESVTVRSVPMLESGFSAVFCAWSSPRESETIAITRPTPTASPSTVRIVRALRRSSSLRRYER